MKIKKLLFLTIMLFSASLVFGQWQIDEGFEGGVMPAGWTTSTWGVYSVPGYPHTGDYLAASGMGNDWLITPQVSIQSGDSFTLWVRAWMGEESFNVKLSTTGTSTGDFTTTLGTYTNVGESWVEYSYDLSAYTGSAYLAIEVIAGGDYCLALDDVKVGQDAPSCPAPSSLNVTNILETQADFGWTENGSATVWNIEVGAIGFTPGTGTQLVAYTGVTSNPYTGIGLTASSNYDFYVQADCGGRETSTWAGPEAFSTPSAPSGLAAGDIAFTAFNADGDDDFAIVALSDIPANATFYFTDNEPNADGSGFADFNEGTLEWATGGAVISAGTIVVFTDTDSGTNPLFGASIGTLSIPSFDGAMNLSGSGDALYAFEGSPEFDGITTWLAGIQNEANNQGANFDQTGLTVGTTFINFYTTGSPDGGFYSGDRGRQSSFSDYLPLLGDNSNWTVESSNGENILPISTTAFTTFSGPDDPAGFAATAASPSEIDLDWTQNGDSDDVLVAWSSDGIFGRPVNGSTYSNGDPIPDGGTVLYYGSLLHYDHTGLPETTQYFYSAWSYDGSEYSYGVTDDATTQCVPYTEPFSENFDSVTEPDMPDNWTYLEISPSTYGSVGTYELLTWCLSAPNIMKMYKINVADDLLLITPQLGDLTSQSNQIRFQGRASGWSQDLIIGAMSDPTNETTFTAVQTVTLIVTGGVSVWEEYTVVFDDESSYNGTDEYIAFKQGADYTYRTLYIEDFVYEPIPSPPATAQDIDLLSGYQFISTRIIPENPDMLEVMADNLNDNLDFVRNTAGFMLRKIGPNWVNSIGDWITTEGYLFKMNFDDELTISGEAIDPQTPIDLVTGYQMIGFLPETPVNTTDVFANVLENLEFVRNTAGFMFRKIGPNWVNSIGDMLPGEGYLVKMINPDVLIYPVEGEKFTGITNIETDYFNFDGGNAADPVYTIYFEGLEMGDEVAVFDGNKMVGASVVVSEYVLENSVPVFSTLTEEKGFEANNPISLVVWDTQNQTEVSATYTFDNEYAKAYAKTTFPSNDGEFSVINVTKGSLGIDANSLSEVSIYPNPATDLLNIVSENSIKQITIFNFIGQTMFDSEINNTNTVINTSTYQSGVYIIRIETAKSVKTEKITIK